MATYPCQRCGNPFQGPAKNAYLSIFEGEEAAKWRFVVCSECQESLTEGWTTQALYRDEHGQWAFPEAGMSWLAFFQPTQAPERSYSRRNGS